MEDPTPTDPNRMSNQQLLGLMSLAVEMQHWHHANLASEQECVRCHASVHTPLELEPTPLCHLCAQVIAEQLPVLIYEISCLRVAATAEAWRNHDIRQKSPAAARVALADVIGLDAERTYGQAVGGRVEELMRRLVPPTEMVTGVHIPVIRVDRDALRRGAPACSARCICEWQGPSRSTAELADMDAQEHERTMSSTPVTEVTAP